jgi:hypothetical protein
MSTLSFPLYDTLATSLIETPESEIDLTKLVKQIHSLDQDGKNKVYALIRYHCQKHMNEPLPTTVLPFDGQKVDNELVFNLDRFPRTLQVILAEFCKVHIKHMKYIQKIEKIRKKSVYE